MDVLGCPRKDVAVTLSWYRREHRRRRPAPDRRIGAAAGCADRAGAGAQMIRLWHAVTGGCGRGRRGERPSAQVRVSVRRMLAKRRTASHWDGHGLAEGAGVRPAALPGTGSARPDSQGCQQSQQ
jgi:hypothetical protein